MKYIVSFSGGLTSYEAARRALVAHGKDAVELWFCDVGAEDPDLYRFNRDVERVLGVEIRVLRDPSIGPPDERVPGATLWDLFDAQGMIANTRADFCSRIGKRDLFRSTLEAEFAEGEAVVVLGMDNIEDCDRIIRARNGFQRTHDKKGRQVWKASWETWFPLTEDPAVFKSDIAEALAQEGVAQPALYDLGAAHNNCGGFCVKAGFGHFAWLHSVMPERYAYHEERERLFRARAGKDVSVLRDRRGGKARPLTLEALRKRIEAGEKFRMPAGFACNCFSADE